MRDAPPELTTTRIGGGRSAWLIAGCVVGVLVAVVAVAVAGRPAPAPPVALVSPEPSAAPVASDAPTANTPPQRTPPPSRTISAIRPDSAAPRPYQFLGTVLHVAGQGFVAELVDVGDGRYYAAYRIPFPRLAREASLEIADISATTSHESWSSLGRWDISLDPISPETRQAGKVLDVLQFPRSARGGSALGRSGFRVTVYAEGRLNFGLLTIEVRGGIERPYPDESYAVDARVGDFATRVGLPAIEPGHFSAVLIIPDSVTADELHLALVAMPANNPMLGMLTIYEFDIDMPPHGRFDTGGGASASAGPQPPRPGMPELLTFGHQFQAQTAYSGFLRAVVLDLQLFGGFDPAGDDGGYVDMAITWPPDRTAERNLVVYRDWPLRKDKHDLAILYRSFIDLER